MKLKFFSNALILKERKQRHITSILQCTLADLLTVLDSLADYLE